MTELAIIFCDAITLSLMICFVFVRVIFLFDLRVACYVQRITEAERMRKNRRFYHDEYEVSRTCTCAHFV